MKRSNPDIVYLPNDGVFIMFGGQGSAGISNETWEYNYNSNTWSKLGTNGYVGKMNGHSSRTV